MERLTFRPVTAFPRGTLAALLRDGYFFQPEYERSCGAQWIEFDDFFYDNPVIADKYGFVSCLGGEAVGLASWDPRNRPAYVEVGHNCIASAYKGRGCGRAQMIEAVRRIRLLGADRIIVTTDEALIPAQRMYEAAGFQRIGARENETTGWFTGRYVDYEIRRT